jgi:MFS family permease
VFDWNNKQNGALIGSIGVISALLQGGYVRRALPKVGEGMMARRGVSACALGLVLLALVPLALPNQRGLSVALLRGAAVCMAFTSATVVNALTAYASLQCDEGVDADTGKPAEEHPDLAKGKALGRFRSSGQLGRAIGPLLGTSLLFLCCVCRQ